MKELCDQLRPDFDFIILDCPAGIEGGFKNASAGAAEALVVTTPEITAVRDADRIIGMLESMGKSPIRLIINRFRPIMVQNNDMLSQDDILDILSINLIGVVPEDDSVTRATSSGEPLALEQETPAGQAYANIAARILGEDVPLLPLDAPSEGIFSSLKKMFGF